MPPRPVRSRISGELVHPGRILFERCLRPFEISQNALASAMGMPPRRVNEIVLGKRSITAETALALEEVLGLPAHYWMALQADYDIEMAGARAPKRGAKARPMRPLEDAPPGTPRFPPEWRLFAADMVEHWEAFDEGREK